MKMWWEMELVIFYELEMRLKNINGVSLIHYSQVIPDMNRATISYEFAAIPNHNSNIVQCTDKTLF